MPLFCLFHDENSVCNEKKDSLAGVNACERVEQFHGDSSMKTRKF